MPKKYNVHTLKIHMQSYRHRPQLAFFPPLRRVQSITDIFLSYYLETLDKTVGSLPKFCRTFNKVNGNIGFVFLVTIF